MSERGSFRLARGVPWALSLSRLGLAAAFPFLGPVGQLAAVVAASVSDALDGYAARRLGVAGWWGGVVDAATDKLFTLTVLGVLTYEGALSWWQLALLLPRDVVILGLIAGFAARRHWSAYRQIGHRLLGKAATACQFALLIALILAPDLGWLTWPLFGLAAGVTVVAALDYAVVFGPVAMQAPEVAGV